MNALFEDMTEEQYFSIEAASNSVLNRMTQSPAHCKYYMETPFKQTDSMLLGSVVHCLLLEPELFEARYAVEPNWDHATDKKIDKRTKTGKAIMQNFENSVGDKKVISADIAVKAKTMANAAEGTVKQYIKNGSPEVSMIWEDKETKLKCKGRVDYVRDFLIDIKTTDNASPRAFQASILKYGYYRQAAMYMDGYEAITGNRPSKFVFIAIESKPPYVTTPYTLDQEAIDIGQFDYRKLLIQYKQCCESGIWPGYEPGTIHLPEWKIASFENELSEIIY